MAIRKIKPTTPGQRGMTVSAFEEITCTKPERSLLEDLKSTGGRNNAGRITVRHRGGGAKRKYRVIDFKRNKDGIPAKVATIEYDPNRSANIALLHYADGEKRYIIAPLGLQVGDSLLSGEGADIKVGNALQIKNIPVGAMIHCIELKPGKGAQLVRSAGNAAQLMAKEGKYAQVRLPSGEVRRIPMDAKATIGQVGNVDHVMNPCDHPHGGGEGKSPVGRPGPVTPWGKPALGYKTRKTKNVNDKFIVRRRDGK